MPGYKISNYDGIPQNIKPIACNKGTKVEVSEIFYNLPARKKFLKSQLSEWNMVKKTVSLKALSNLNVSFRLYHNNEPCFFTNGNGDFKEAFFSIYKNEFTFDIYEYFNKINDDIEIQLYYTASDVFFPTRKYQELFVNKRPVTVNFLYTSIE